MTDGAFEVDAYLHCRDGLVQVTERFIALSKVPACDRLAAPVADLAGNREKLLVELNSAPGLAQLSVCGPHVSQRSALAALVADLAGNRELLLVELDSAPGLAQRSVCGPYVSQRSALAAPVAHLA